MVVSYQTKRATGKQHKMTKCTMHGRILEELSPGIYRVVANDGKRECVMESQINSRA